MLMEILGTLKPLEVTEGYEEKGGDATCIRMHVML